MTVGRIRGAVVTLTVLLPEAPAYTDALVASGVYAAATESLPAVKDPAGIVIVALPPERVAAAEV